MNAKPYVVFITEILDRRVIYQKLPKANTWLVSVVHSHQLNHLR